MIGFKNLTFKQSNENSSDYLKDYCERLFQELSEKIVADFSPCIKRLMFSTKLSEDVCIDIFWDSFVYCFRPRYSPELAKNNATGYLYNKMAKMAIDHFRQKKRKHDLVDVDIDSLSVHPCVLDYDHVHDDEVTEQIELTFLEVSE